MERRTFIQTLVFSSGYIVLKPHFLKRMDLFGDSFKIVMIYNNTGTSPNLKNAWGLSIWIEREKNTILFDTGGDGSILKGNIQNLSLNSDKLTKIVISHNHWDHINGIRYILEKTLNKPKIYVVDNDLEGFNNLLPGSKINGISKSMQIEPEVWTTGQLIGSLNGNQIFEQSLILIQNNSIVLLTGCSHPGIVQIVKRTREIFPDKKIECIAGGFHLMTALESEVIKISEDLKNLGVKKIAPSHCTGEKAISCFRNEWGDNFIELDLGMEMSL